MPQRAPVADSGGGNDSDGVNSKMKNKKKWRSSHKNKRTNKNSPPTNQPTPQSTHPRFRRNHYRSKMGGHKEVAISSLLHDIMRR